VTTGQFYVRPGPKQEKWAGIMVIGPSYPHTVEPDTKQGFSLSISTAAGIPQASDLTPGAITIARVRAGVEATVVDADVCSAVAGVIYYEYTFPSASWQAGDEYKAVFRGQKLTSYPLSEVRCGGRVSREHLGSYFEQTVPLAVNCVQHLDNTAANKDFIPSGTRGASGLVSTDDTKVKKVILTIIGSVVNTAGVANALDCTDPTHNQWQINLDGPHERRQPRRPDEGQRLATAQRGILPRVQPEL